MTNLIFTQSSKNITYKIFFVFGIIFCTFLIAQSANAATYYVDATEGDDNNDGLSTETAWKTIGMVEGQEYSAGADLTE